MSDILVTCTPFALSLAPSAPTIGATNVVQRPWLRPLPVNARFPEPPIVLARVVRAPAPALRGSINMIAPALKAGEQRPSLQARLTAPTPLRGRKPR
jgi:hypothetical protein